MKRKILYSLFRTACTALCFFITPALLAQTSLMQIDTELLYKVKGHLIKNNGLTVIADRSINDGGLSLHEIGFRVDSYSKKIELLIQFKSNSGIESDLGLHLFGPNQETIWEDSIVRKDQPQEHNLISMIVRTNLTELSSQSVLYLWARKPIVKFPYEMWEWMDVGPSDWLVLTIDSLASPLQADSLIVYNENEVSQKPVFNYNGESDLQYIQRNVIYPTEAKENNVQGVVVVVFTISPDGSVQDAVLSRDIGAGCGKAALTTITSMPFWTPGTVDGKAVPVRVVRPVRFRL